MLGFFYLGGLWPRWNLNPPPRRRLSDADTDDSRLIQPGCPYQLAKQVSIVVKQHHSEACGIVFQFSRHSLSMRFWLHHVKNLSLNVATKSLSLYNQSDLIIPSLAIPRNFLTRMDIVRLQSEIPGFRKGFDYERCFSCRRSIGPCCRAFGIVACRACVSFCPCRGAAGQMSLGMNLLAGIRAHVGLRSNPQRPAPVKSASFAGVTIGVSKW